MQYAESDGNRTDVLITMIDCSVQGDECGHFYITGTPHMVLVMGPHRRYWPRVGSREGKEWNIFLDRYINPAFREVHNDSELLQAKREPYDGGTAFHLETPVRESELMDELTRFSKEYRIYNDTFTYHIDETLKKPILTAHTSPYCSVTWTSGNLQDFLEKYKFGSRHRYDMGEFYYASQQSRTAMLLVEDGLGHGQSYALEKIPKDFCQEIIFGYISVKETKEIIKEIHRDRIMLPVLVHTNKAKCRTFYFGKTSEAASSGFLRITEKGDLCDRAFVFGVLEEEEYEEELEEEKHPAAVSRFAGVTILGSKFAGLFMGVCMTVIMAARIRLPVEEKLE
jgi:hypothetical protein